MKHFRLAETLGGEEATRLFPHDWRVQTFFDGGPDREGRREVEAIDRQVRAVTHTDLVDRVKEVVGGVAGEHIRQARLDAHADERQQTLVAPVRVGRQLGRAEGLTDFVVRVRRVRLREIHCHVDIGAARLESRLKNGIIQAGVAGVDDDVDLVRLSEGDDVGLVAGVNFGGCETRRVVEGLQGINAALLVDIGEHEVVEERPRFGNGCHAGPDSAGSDDENAAHGWGFLTDGGCGGTRAPSGYRGGQPRSCECAQPPRVLGQVSACLSTRRLVS